jgi:hypothetical protein
MYPGRQSWVHFGPKSKESPQGRLKNVCDKFSRPLRDWTHLLILPRTDVLGYIHAVPSGLHRAPGEIIRPHCRWSSVNASGAVQIDRAKKLIWTSLTKFDTWQKTTDCNEGRSHTQASETARWFLAQTKQRRLSSSSRANNSS